MGIFRKKRADDSASAIKNWYKDKHQSVMVQRNILALMTMLSLVVAGASVFTVMQLTPLKSLEPFVISIDEQTGVVQRVDSVSVEDITGEEAINNYFVVNYVRSRETFDISTIRQNYGDVRIMSSRPVYREFLLEKRRTNPESPQAVLKDSGRRTVKVKRISYLPSPESEAQGVKVAQVTAVMEDRKAGSPVPQTYNITVTISFKFAELNLSREERYRNPLGFQVVTYRLDRDTL